MKIRLKSDGSSFGTRVEDMEGRQVHGVQSISLDINNADPIVHIDVRVAAAIDVVGSGSFFVVDPKAGGFKEVAKIVFADGSEWSAQEKGS